MKVNKNIKTENQDKENKLEIEIIAHTQPKQFQPYAHHYIKLHVV